MRRIFSSPIAALAAGACLRFFFFLHYPGGAGDTALYEGLATNWFKFHTYGITVDGVLTPVDTRMPGYPLFLAIIYWISGKSGPDARPAIMVTQVIVDLLTCLVIGAVAATLSSLASDKLATRRSFVAAVWLAALCPFTSNYVAVVLTETLATFFTALAVLFLCLLLARLRSSTPVAGSANLLARLNASWCALLIGLAAGLGTLFRPETPLLLVVACAVLAWHLARSHDWLRMVRIFALMVAGCILPLAPWAIRNAVTLHEVQFLAPKNATLPSELVPYGFMAWEKTWLFRLKDCYQVAWKLNDEAIQLEDIPARAFDTPEEKERVAAILEKYNEDTTFTDEEDTSFGELAKERTARHPLRTYLWIPLARATTIWLSPRIELLPFSGKVFPLGEAWEEDPVDQSVTIFFVILNIFYLALGGWGPWKLWRYPGARIAVALLSGYIIVRTAFLATLETPEPRYVLVCFPILLALAAQSFHPRNAREDQLGAPSETGIEPAT
ncbi:MAG TPA: hypothetical protein VIM00_01835 [Candidatus Acidoferrum sp.]|jgi:hypothetical protein